MSVNGLCHRVQRIAIAALGIITIGLLVQPIIELTARVPKNYNEGWNAFHSLRALGAETLYPSTEQLFTNNYPPLSFYAVGFVGQLLGDNIIAGRLIALFSLLLLAISIFCILRRPLHCSITVSLFSTLLFLGYMGTHYRNYVGMNDPQLLGHAIQTTAVLLIGINETSHRQSTRSRLLLSGLAMGLIVASLFVKHSLLPVPVTLAIWLLYTTREKWIWLAMGLGSIGLVACLCTYGPDFINNVFLSPRQYQPDRILDKLFNHWLYPVILWILWGGWFGLRSGKKFYGHLLILYLAISLTLATVMLGGQGINYNALFDVLVCLVLLLGVGLNHLEHSPWAAQRQLFWMGILTLPILLALPFVDLAAEWQGVKTAKVSTATAIQKIAATEGAPVMCEMLALCYWANQPLEVDFFNMGQKLKTGTMDTAHLIELIEQQHFAIIQLDDDKGSKRLPTSINQAIFKYYQVRPPVPPETVKHPVFLFYPVRL